MIEKILNLDFFYKNNPILRKKCAFGGKKIFHLFLRPKNRLFLLKNMNLWKPETRQMKPEPTRTRKKNARFEPNRTRKKNQNSNPNRSRLFATRHITIWCFQFFRQLAQSRLKISLQSSSWNIFNHINLLNSLIEKKCTRVIDDSYRDVMYVLIWFIFCSLIEKIYTRVSNRHSAIIILLQNIF